MEPDPTAFPSNGLLDPLEVLDLRPPFVDAPTTPSLILGDVTPISIAMTFATPELGEIFLSDGDDRSRWDMVPPPAPLLKDMDSFTEGTAQGSFDFSLDSSSTTSQHITSAVQPVVESVAFSPEHPSRSIELWIYDVQNSLDNRDTQPATPYTPTNTPFDLPTPTHTGVQDRPRLVQPRPYTLKRHLSSAFESVCEQDHVLSSRGRGDNNLLRGADAHNSQLITEDPYAAGMRYRPRRRELSPDDVLMIERPSSAPPSF